MTTTASINLDLRRIVRLIPGYDPFATAPEGCWFDDEAAAAAISFFPERLRHVEGAMAGEPFVLEPWQQAIVGNLFGWKRRDKRGREIRRYRECLIFVPRKCGKSPTAAGIALYGLFCDPERGQQNYLAASTKEQAGLVLFRQCRGMIEQCPELDIRCKVFGGSAPAGQSQSIVREAMGSFLKILSADTTVGKHGKNPNLVIVDELHEFPNRDLVDTFHTAMVSANKPQPLLIYTTTSDYARESICNEIHDYACKVRDGIIAEPSFLPVIYEASFEDDWTSPEVWRKVNPNIDVSVSEEDLARECKLAQELPAKENEFKRLHLNIKTEQATRWLPMPKWDASDQPIDLKALLGKPCWSGLDLSTTTDVSAFVMVFPDGAGSYDVLPKFWVPEENARQRERRDRVPYQQWIKEGFVSATPGDVIDYDAIRRDINALKKLYNINEIAADRWNATQIITQLDGDGLVIFPFGQGYKDMTAPAKELEKLVVSGKLRCGKNPVMRWMASNASIEQDAAGNIKPSKSKSSERIDGIVALVMGLSRAMMRPNESIYETRGVLTV